MPVAKPTVLPRWSTTGSIIEPTEGKKNLGWQVEEKPPAEYMNWLQERAYRWIEWVDDLEKTDGHTWASALTWAKSQTWNLFGKFVATNVGNLRQKVIEFIVPGAASTDPKIRVFVGLGLNTFRIEIVGGAEWADAGAVWVPDNTASQHTQWRLQIVGRSLANGARFSWSTIDALANFADGAWIERFGISNAGATKATGATNATALEGEASGTGSGVKGTAATGGSAIGVEGTGAIGVKGTATGTLQGVVGVGDAGDGVNGSSASGCGGRFQGNATRAALHLVPAAAQPNGPSLKGDLYVNIGDAKLYICTVAGTPGTWVSVGSQA